jgi:Na+-translocating ferredoxin:NAD+ oxidoreductase RnfG subunit
MKLQLIAVLLAPAMLAILFAPVRAGVFMTREDAVKAAFPDADQIDERSFDLDDAKAKQIEELARSELPSRSMTAYIGLRNRAALGYAFIDTAMVRTMPATFIVVIAPDGAVHSIETLAFYEPSEYLPTQQWYSQFKGKALTPALELHREINGVAGATLSSQAVTSAVRRSLALYQVLLKGKE